MDKKVSKKKPTPITIIISINGKDPIIKDVDNEDQAKILQSKLNLLYGRSQVRTEFIYKD